MEQNSSEVNLFDHLKITYTVASPATIREKVTAWAFEDAEDISTVIARLERLDCAACYSPAPIYYADMAREIGEHWPEIDDVLENYRDNAGEAWTPKPGQSFLNHVWFAYEWTAYQLASEIRGEIEG